MRNPFRSTLNLSVAALAALVLSPVVFGPAPAYARGGGGGGGGKGASSGSGNKGGKNGNGKSGAGKGKTKGGTTAGQAKDPAEYLLQMQQQDSEDDRADFQFEALFEASMDSRDADRAVALAANRERQSQQLLTDDLPRP